MDIKSVKQFFKEPLDTIRSKLQSVSSLPSKSGQGESFTITVPIDPNKTEGSSVIPEDELVLMPVVESDTKAKNVPKHKHGHSGREHRTLGKAGVTESSKHHRSGLLQDDSPLFEELVVQEINVDTTTVPTQELDDLIRDVRDVKEMSREIGKMLDVQQESIEKIEVNTEKTTDNLVKSEKELNMALKYKNDGIINVVGATGGALIGSIFGPPGALVGAVGGLATSLVINIVR
ncbi:putative T-snare protein [Yasminevirus sp. GU-2018]|uniref:Putative T-snare protein n=1 Tax=Yasminevirus sp. GU-2018 TaxID=2420051 RepID=A0A5K0U8C4_9VIRU|nr:putative T-snare protein [Yasminevirus sp. GU-2018]